MKKISSLIIGLLIALALCGNSTAYTIDAASIEVGRLDTNIKEAYDLTNNGKNAELAWVNAALIKDTTYSYRIQNTDGDFVFNWKETDTSGIWAHFLGWSPEYFLVKIGQKEYLFKNVDSSSYLVIDFSSSIFDLPGNSQTLTTDAFSHITTFGGSPTTASVPEPATLLLLGFGLLGIAGVSRKQK